MTTPALPNSPLASLRETWRGDPLAAFKRELDRPSDGFFDDVTPESQTQPRIDVRETDGHVLIAADLPGMSPDQLDLNVQGDLSTLSGRHRRERVFGRFERPLRLPFEVGDGAVEAKHEHGALNVRAAKPEGHPSRAPHPQDAPARLMPSVARVMLVATLVVNPWLFALGTTFWVAALTAPTMPSPSDAGAAKPNVAAASAAESAATRAMA